MSSWTINKHLKGLLKLCKESLMGYYDKACIADTFISLV